MTLRVTVEIVPFGQESKKYTIHTLEMSNLGITEGTSDRYSYWTQWRDGDGIKESPSHMTYGHRRDEGAWKLIKKAMAYKEMNKDQTSDKSR